MANNQHLFERSLNEDDSFVESPNIHSLIGKAILQIGYLKVWKGGT